MTNVMTELGRYDWVEIERRDGGYVEGFVAYATPTTIKVHRAQALVGAEADPVAVLLACDGRRSLLRPGDVYDRRAAVGRLTAWGWSGTQIAERLGISRRTVSRHRTAIRRAA